VLSCSMDPYDFDLQEQADSAAAYNEANRFRGSNREPTNANRGRQRSRPAERTNRRRAQCEPAAARPRQARRTDNHTCEAQASDDLPRHEQYEYAWQQQRQQQQQQMFDEQLRDAQALLGQYQRDAEAMGAEVSLSQWHQRKQADHQQWRQQAPSLFCASLQHQAGPSDTSQCTVCGSSDVTVRQEPARSATK
jgi:hypothetical protein